MAIAGKKFIKELSESVGWKILHKLHEVQPTEETLEAIITSLPSVLSVEDDLGDIPIQTVCYKYVGLLIREGVRYNVGGEGKRGGLLLEHHLYGANVLQVLVYVQGCKGVHLLECDLKYKGVLEGLRKSGFLAAVDIIEYKLLYFSCLKESQLRFQYLSTMCPQGLSMIDEHCGSPIFHVVIMDYRSTRESMKLFLRAALEYFPYEVGLLFQKDKYNRTSLEVAISKFGKDETFEIIRQCIPQETSMPILHHVVKHAPQYIGDFILHYPDAIYLRDEQGDKRTYVQARIASGNTTFAKSPEFLSSISPDQIMMVDPVTDLYPFMVAASGETSDLDTVFYLLKREPKLVFEAPKLPDGRKRKSSCKSQRRVRG